ncbi:PH domain-containing protein [Rhizobium sp. 18055]|uniref:PH domain-containing protein n=1 Tax=Rhizobium sp. 18055 TaxID=2681403 RepID=UPI00135BDF97|nr:PH domain-containing protein [Rhizobium sp. 18055]
MPFDFKNATKTELKTEYDRIAKDMGDDQFFTKKELNFLPEVLGEGEQVLAFTSGLMDGNTWLITLTDRRIIFLDKGMVFGLKQSSISLDKVNAVSGETGIIFGSIKIEDGATQREIRNVLKKTVVKFVNKVRDALEARKSPASTNPGPAADVVSMLERLAALKTSGALTDAEFEMQKAKLLAG